MSNPTSAGSSTPGVSMPTSPVAPRTEGGPVPPPAPGGAVPAHGPAHGPGSPVPPPVPNGPVPMALRPGIRPYRFSDVVRSEWTKLRTVRSTWLTLLITVILVVGLGALIGQGAGSHYHNDSFSDKLTFDPTDVSFFSLIIGQLSIAVLAVLMISSEYGTGLIRTSLQAVPRRSWFLGAKAVVFAGVSLVVGEILSFVTYFVVQALLKAGPAPHSTLSQPHVLRAVIGAGVYLTVTGLLALGIGALVRHTAGSITIVAALYFVLPGVSNALPSNWQHAAQKFLPTYAGSQIFAVFHQHHQFTAWVGFAVLCAYTAVILIIAAIALNRRDA